jgi:mRNA-degrading endonuclease toxin of MazEF toxin-antitoxin module
VGAVIAAQPLRWAVLITDLDPTRGHEQGGMRRVLVVSYEAFHRSASMTVCPITAARGVVRYPHEVAIPVGEAGQAKPGVILCHQVRTISQLRVRGTLSPVGYLTDPDLRAQVRSALARQVGLDIPAGLDGATGTQSFKP